MSDPKPLRYLPEYNCFIIPLDMIWPSLLTDLHEHGATSREDKTTLDAIGHDLGFTPHYW